MHTNEEIKLSQDSLDHLLKNDWVGLEVALQQIVRISPALFALAWLPVWARAGKRWPAMAAKVWEAAEYKRISRAELRILSVQQKVATNKESGELPSDALIQRLIALKYKAVPRYPTIPEAPWKEPTNAILNYLERMRVATHHVLSARYKEDAWVQYGLLLQCCALFCIPPEEILKSRGWWGKIWPTKITARSLFESSALYPVYLTIQKGTRPYSELLHPAFCDAKHGKGYWLRTYAHRYYARWENA